MSANTPLPPPAIPPASIPPPAAKKNRWLLFGCGGVLALLLIIVGTVALTIWWIQRPIKPVVLSPRERATVDEKLRRIEGGTAGRSNPGGRPAVIPPGSGLEP